jgi:magnesium chelatase subunit D
LVYLSTANTATFLTGFAHEIAEAAQGHYHYLPNASDAAIAAAASRHFKMAAA